MTARMMMRTAKKRRVMGRIQESKEAEGLDMDALEGRGSEAVGC
jgi:hypothetical protein